MGNVRERAQLRPAEERGPARASPEARQLVAAERAHPEARREPGPGRVPVHAGDTTHGRALAWEFGGMRVHDRLESRAAPPAFEDLGRVQQAARMGADDPGEPLPFLDRIQRSFGHHDLSSVRAHLDPRAGRAAAAMGAEAFAVGDHVGFAGAPTLRTTAHEAAHVIQQRAGVHVPGGAGRAGDEHERHADAVAERVVQGLSSEALLPGVEPWRGAPGPPDAGAPVQRKEAPAPPADAQLGVEGSYLDNGSWDEWGRYWYYDSAHERVLVWENGQWTDLGPAEVTVVHEVPYYQVSEARRMLQEVKRLSETKDPADLEKAIETLTSLHHWSSSIVTSANIDRHYSDGLGKTYVDQLAGGASDALISIQRQLKLVRESRKQNPKATLSDGTWRGELAHFDLGAEVLEVLNDERSKKDSPVSTVVEKSSSYLLVFGAVVAGGFVAIALAGAAAPIIAGEASLLAGALTQAGQAALNVVLTLPIAYPAGATALAELAAGTTVAIVTAGGIRQYLAQLRTTEGRLQMAYQVAGLSVSFAPPGAPPRTIDVEGPGTFDPETGTLQIVVTKVSRPPPEGDLEAGGAPTAGPPTAGARSPTVEEPEPGGAQSPARVSPPRTPAESEAPAVAAAPGPPGVGTRRWFAEDRAAWARGATDEMSATTRALEGDPVVQGHADLRRAAGELVQRAEACAARAGTVTTPEETLELDAELGELLDRVEDLQQRVSRIPEARARIGGLLQQEKDLRQRLADARAHAGDPSPSGSAPAPRAPANREPEEMLSTPRRPAPTRAAPATSPQTGEMESELADLVARIRKASGELQTLQRPLPTGAGGEQLVRDMLAGSGLKVYVVQYGPHGVDLLAETPSGLRVAFEIKTSAGDTAPGLSAAQRDPETYLETRLERAANDRSLSDAQRAVAREFQAAHARGEVLARKVEITRYGTSSVTVTFSDW